MIFRALRIFQSFAHLTSQQTYLQVFSPEAKERALAIVGVIRDTMEERLKTLSWMVDKTKVKALEKLQRFTGKCGYTVRGCARL